MEKCTAQVYGRTLSVCPEWFATVIAVIRGGTTVCDEAPKPCASESGHLQILSLYYFESVCTMGVNKILQNSKVFEF